MFVFPHFERLSTTIKINLSVCTRKSESTPIKCNSPVFSYSSRNYTVWNPMDFWSSMDYKTSMRLKFKKEGEKAYKAFRAVITSEVSMLQLQIQLRRKHSTTVVENHEVQVVWERNYPAKPRKCPLQRKYVCRILERPYGPHYEYIREDKNVNTQGTNNRTNLNTILNKTTLRVITFQPCYQHIF